MVSPNDKGIIPPDEMIDHNNANFSQIENVMTIFVAYNQANIQQGTPWDTWPEWELCLTALNPDLHFEHEDETGEYSGLRKEWLAVMQFIHESENISVNGYTIVVKGLHGNTFDFDICLENEFWMNPGDMEDHVEKILSSTSRRFLSKPIPYIVPGDIEHDLDTMWVCPEHVPEYGGKDTHYTGHGISISPADDDSFPLALQTLLKLCIDDTRIWAIAYLSDLEARQRAEWFEEHWPGGIPDQDWEYQ